MLGPTPLCRIGKAPKALFVYRTAAPLAKLRTPALAAGHVEALGAGQQFVADGIHPDTGNPYRWTGLCPLNLSPRDLPVVDEDGLRAFLAAAEAMIRAAGGEAEEEEAAEPVRPVPASRSDGAPYGGGFARYADCALTDACGAIREAGNGAQFETVRRQAFSIGGYVGAGVLDEGEAIRALTAAALDMPNHDPRDPWKGAELERLVRNAVESGSRKPRVPPPDLGLRRGPPAPAAQSLSAAAVPLRVARTAERRAPPPANDAEATPAVLGRPGADDLDGFALDEDGIALAFAGRYGADLRFCHTAGRSFAWDGSRWQAEKTGLAFEWARWVCREMAAKVKREGIKARLARASTALAVERFARPTGPSR